MNLHVFKLVGSSVIPDTCKVKLGWMAGEKSSRTQGILGHAVLELPLSLHTRLQRMKKGEEMSYTIKKAVLGRCRFNAVHRQALGQKVSTKVCNGRNYVARSAWAKTPNVLLTIGCQFSARVPDKTSEALDKKAKSKILLQLQSYRKFGILLGGGQTVKWAFHCHITEDVFHYLIAARSPGLQ